MILNLSRKRLNCTHKLNCGLKLLRCNVLQLRLTYLCQCSTLTPQRFWCSQYFGMLIALLDVLRRWVLSSPGKQEPRKVRQDPSSKVKTKSLERSNPGSPSSHLAQIHQFRSHGLWKSLKCSIQSYIFLRELFLLDSFFFSLLFGNFLFRQFEFKPMFHKEIWVWVILKTLEQVTYYRVCYCHITTHYCHPQHWHHATVSAVTCHYCHRCYHRQLPHSTTCTIHCCLLVSGGDTVDSVDTGNSDSDDATVTTISWMIQWVKLLRRSLLTLPVLFEIQVKFSCNCGTPETQIWVVKLFRTQIWA